MVIASLVGATLVPSLLVRRRTASTTVFTITAWVLWVALAVGPARRWVMPRVGGRGADAGSQPGETDTKSDCRRSGQMHYAHYQLLSENNIKMLLSNLA
jgi:hypothetical protein